MTIEAEESVAARDRRARELLDKQVKAGGLTSKRFVAKVAFTLAALFDERVGHGVKELLDLSRAVAVDPSAPKRECFVCCTRWSEEVAPIGVLCVEILGPGDNAILSLICQHCFTGGMDAALVKAIRRDFGCQPASMTFIHDAPGEDQ